MHRKVVVVRLNASNCLSQGGWPTLSMDQVVKLWLGECGIVKLLHCWPSHVNMLMSCTHKSQHILSVSALSCPSPSVSTDCRVDSVQYFLIWIQKKKKKFSSNPFAAACFDCQSWPTGEGCNAQDLWPAGGGRFPPHPPPLRWSQVQAGAQCPWGELFHPASMLTAS